MTKKTKVLIGVLLAAIVIALGGFGSLTYAWLTDTGTDSVTYTMGDVEYELAYSDTVPAIVVPGQNIVDGDSLVITNTSTVVSDIRLKLTVEKQNGAEWNDVTPTWTIGTDAAADEILISIGDGWAFNNGFYYRDDVAAAAVIPNFLTSLEFNGWLVGNDSSNGVYRFTFEFQAKQAAEVEWANIDGATTFNWQTGVGTPAA